MSDRLDEILRNDAQHTIPDAGFSTRVMRALPPPALHTRRGLQPALILGSAFTGCLLAVFLAPADAGIAQGFVDLMHLKLFTPAAIAGLAMAAALLVSAVVLAAEAD